MQDHQKVNNTKVLVENDVSLFAKDLKKKEFKKETYIRTVAFPIFRCASWPIT